MENDFKDHVNKKKSCKWDEFKDEYVARLQHNAQNRTESAIFFY